MTIVSLILGHNVRLSLSLLLPENAEKLSILLSDEFLDNFKWDGYLSDDGITSELSEEEDLLSNKEALVQYTVRSPQEEALIPQAEEELEVKQKAQALRSLPLHVKEGGSGSTETPNVNEWDVQETRKKDGRGQRKSRDALASLDGGTGHLEIAIRDVKDGVGIVEQNLQTLKDHVSKELESLKRAVGAKDELCERFMELFASLQEQFDMVKEFTTLMLHIPNMAEDDLFFNFVDSLQSWAKKELQRRGMKNVDKAIAMVKSLTEYDRGGDPPTLKEVDETSGGNHANGGGESPKAWHKGGKHASTRKSKGLGKLEEKHAKSKPKDRCFFCVGPYWARDCPRQGKLAALVKEKEKKKSERETVRIGSLEVLNALQRKNVPQVPTIEGQTLTSKGLLYVEAKLNGEPTQVLVDTGVTHNFMTMEEAERLGLNVVTGGGWLKTINTEVNALVSPYNNVVCIMERGVACLVPTFGETSSTMTPTMELSGMRLVEAVEDVKAKGEGTYLASLKIEDHVVALAELPREARTVLKAKKDVAKGAKRILEEKKHVVRAIEGTT
ncbi:hypothetical protein RJ640_013535 [Escallonia rubra]|uniref:Uncharacterized protein n=1 Tax=Escallonia rubra TaxID=112253 RepID=A0AA88QXU0_9ASTE|nr:hypothetical protein RJ640_013535 [Escallonia rubra]